MKGGRYIDTGQYDHHVWLYYLLRELKLDLMCYGTCFMMVTTDGSERIPPEKVMVKP